MNNEVRSVIQRAELGGCTDTALGKHPCVGDELSLREFMLTLQSFLVLAFFELNSLHPYKEDSSSS